VFTVNHQVTQLELCFDPSSEVREPPVAEPVEDATVHFEVHAPETKIVTISFNSEHVSSQHKTIDQQHEAKHNERQNQGRNENNKTADHCVFRKGYQRSHWMSDHPKYDHTPDKEQN
jgi:hypothetical protein